MYTCLDAERLVFTRHLPISIGHEPAVEMLALVEGFAGLGAAASFFPRWFRARLGRRIGPVGARTVFAPHSPLGGHRSPDTGCGTPAPTDLVGAVAIALVAFLRTTLSRGR